MSDDPVVVSIDAYEEATENYLGWCPNCREFCVECVEPDAHDYPCDACGENDVVGAEDALLTEMITIEGD